MSHLIHIADRVLNRPLMILPDKLALIASVLEGRIGIDASEFKERDFDAALREGPSASRFVGQGELLDPNNPRAGIKYKISKGVAIIPVLGSLVNRGAWIGSNSGMTSYEGLDFQITDAATNSGVKAIILDIDSPGGEAVGAFEIAERVRSAGKAKPIVAVVNGMAASAAYAIASAATQIVGTASSVSGSIGVVLMHADYSNFLHQKGIKPTLIHAGAHKVDGNPYEPLSESVHSDLQAEVDKFYSLFVSGVAKGRKGRMTEEAIRSTEARTYIGRAAVDAGLVDAIGSFDTVLAELADGSNSHSLKHASTSSAGLSFNEGSMAASIIQRPNAEKAQIIVAGREAGLDALAALAAEHSPAVLSTASALELIAIARAENLKAARQDQLHPSGLWMGTADLRVSGGPLFAQTDSQTGPAVRGDHGWSTVIDRINRQH
jgi:signal peptide peptidase SppA